MLPDVDGIVDSIRVQAVAAVVWVTRINDDDDNDENMTGEGGRLLFSKGRDAPFDTLGRIINVPYALYTKLPA